MENLPTYRLTQSGPEAQEILDQVNLNTIDIEQLKRLYQALTQSEPEIIEPNDTWPVANPEENVIYRVIDRVNTPPQYYTDYMWNGTSMVPMAQYNNAIDNEPTVNSNNLVKSGGVYSFVHANGGAYDISAAHAVGGVLATYDDLADALGTNGANVPAAVRKGGMSIKFVQTSDNKYVQYRYMSTSTANANIANVTNWQGVEEEPTAGSDNLVKSGGVYEKLNSKLDKVIGKNLFDPSTFVLGKWITTSGIANVGYGIGMTGFIPISEGETLCIRVIGGDGLYQCRFGLFDANQNFISGTATESLPQGTFSGTITGTASSKYAAFSIRQAPSSTYKVQVEVGSTPTAYEPYYDYYPLQQTKEELQEQIDEVKNQITPPLTWINNCFLATDSTKIAPDNNRCVSDWVYCRGAKTLVACCETGNMYVAGIRFYDIHKLPISVLSNTSTSFAAVTVDVPDGAVWMRIGTTIAQKGNSYVKISTPLLYEAIVNDDIVSEKFYSPQEYDITNYLLLVDVYDKSRWSVDSNTAILQKTNQTTQYKSTSLAILDKTKPIVTNVTYTSYAFFFDSQKNYLSNITIYSGKNITPSDYPSDAYYVAFSYQYGTTRAGMTPFFATKSEYGQIKFLECAVPSILKKIGERPIINIYLADSVIEIFNKMMTAVVTEDCDVYFEYGTYDLSAVFSHIKTLTSNYLEIPIGGNCRYFFNNSTLVANIDTWKTDYPSASDTLDLLSNLSVTKNRSFELNDANIIGTGLTYCIHDEGQSLITPYITRYNNVKIKYVHDSRNTANLRKCIGGGTGRFAEIIIKNCYFEMEPGTGINKTQEVSYHGINNNESSADTRLNVYNTYFKNGLGLHSLGSNQKALCIYCGNTAKQNVENYDTESVGVWAVKSWSNETHT